jgi:hypothetical protein
MMTKFRKVTIGVDINASKEEVWDVLFNRFGEVNNFNPLIEGSQPSNDISGEVGAERICDLDSKNAIHEKITGARGNESFDVDIIKGNMPFINKAKATFDLKAVNENQTNVNLIMNFTAKPAFMVPMMKIMMPKMLRKMLIGLKYHLETDNLVTKDNIKGILKEYKDLQKKELSFKSVQLSAVA